MSDPGPGAVLNGTYRLEYLLGEGGMGRVYAAQHLRVPRRFAVKLLAPDLAPSASVLERFRREADIASALGSQHIVQVLDFDRTPEGVPYMVLELLEGEDLGARLQRGRLSVGDTLELLRQVTAALELAHARGIVHRDLKPANLFLCRDGLVKIMDFGISKVLHTSTAATRTGMILGTPNYMAPEQAQGKVEEIDPRTDLFALGAILYECLSGRIAFQGDTGISTLFQICHHEPPSLASLAPELPPGVIAVVERALAKSPAARFGSAAELHQAFAHAATAPPPPPVTMVLAPPTRLLTPTTLGGAASELTAPRPRVHKPFLALGALVTMLAGAGAFWITRAPAPAISSPNPSPSPSPNPNPNPIPSPNPAPVAAPVPAPVPAPAPATVRLTLAVTPADATVILDDRPVAGPIDLPADGAPHALVVRARGCRTHRQTVTLTADTTVVVKLARDRRRSPAGPPVEEDW